MQKTRQGRTFIISAAVLLLSGVVIARAQSQIKDQSTESAKKGRVLYVRYCVSCHGPSGNGDGPAASSLKVPPADLTNISQRYNGFPEEKMMDYINGEKYAVGHGSREMPVWGKRLHGAASGQSAGKSDVYMLTMFLQSIQKK
jgi:mono/diheme cytochrome c family protein